MLTAIDENGQVVNLLEIEVKELTRKIFFVLLVNQSYL